MASAEKKCSENYHHLAFLPSQQRIFKWIFQRDGGGGQQARARGREKAIRRSREEEDGERKAVGANGVKFLCFNLTKGHMELWRLNIKSYRFRLLFGHQQIFINAFLAFAHSFWLAPMYMMRRERRGKMWIYGRTNLCWSPLFLFLCVLLLFWNAFDSRRVRNTVANKIKFSYICFKLMSCMCFYVCCICISGFRMLSQFAIIEPSRHHVMVVAAFNACVCVLCTRQKSFGSEIVARIVHKRHILCIDLSHWVYLIGINRTGFSSVLSLIMTISG